MRETIDFAGRYGVWRVATLVDGNLAARIERMGFTSLWLGGVPGEFAPQVLELLDSTESMVVATGIVSIWRAEAERTAAMFHEIEAAHPGRFLLGIGSSHRESAGEGATKPLPALTRYLERLHALGVPRRRVVLAALGPRVTALAAERTGGAHSYLVTPDHTRLAREVVDGALLVPEQHVLLQEDQEIARATAREALALYLDRLNYRRSWLRQGFTAEDLANGGSDRFIDQVVAHGSAEHIAEVLRTHVALGADHVVAQVIGDSDPSPTLSTLARSLGLTAT